MEDALKSLGLTSHEAQVYINTVQKGDQTGYEIANATGIARANVYAALSSLLDKGYVHKVNQSPARYVAVSPAELSSKVLHSIEEASRVVINNLKPQKQQEDTVINLDGENNIIDKIIFLIDSASATIYLDASAIDLELLSVHLIRARERGVKVVIICLGKCNLPNMLVYENQSPASWIIAEGRPIRLIIDSILMLTAELGRNKLSRGICSGNASLVIMAKHSFTQEIILAEIRIKFEQQMIEQFGPDFVSIREKVSNTQRKDEFGGIYKKNI